MRLALLGCFISMYLMDTVTPLPGSYDISGAPSAENSTHVAAERITDKIAALPADGEYVSLEFFPPKTEKGFSNLRERIGRAKQALKPLFVSVTWRVGGSTPEQSFKLAELCQREHGVTTLLHLACTNMSYQALDKTLEDAKALGIRNILALRGNLSPNDGLRGNLSPNDGLRDTNDPKEKPAAQDLPWAIDLVRYIRQKYHDYFCIGVAAYPEGHFNESFPSNQSLEHDLPYLVDKVQAGADFIISQLFFDGNAYDKFESTLREHPSGVLKTIPIIPGILPIQSYKTIEFGAKLAHAAVPSTVMARLDAVKEDKEQVKSVGVDIVSELVEHVRATQGKHSGRRGYHFFSSNQEKPVSLILERTHLIPAAQDNKEADSNEGTASRCSASTAV